MEVVYGVILSESTRRVRVIDARTRQSSSDGRRTLPTRSRHVQSTRMVDARDDEFHGSVVFHMTNVDGAYAVCFGMTERRHVTCNGDETLSAKQKRHVKG